MIEHYDVILTALHERRNRLVKLDMENKVNERAVGTLRGRINQVTDAIQALTKANPHAH